MRVDAARHARVRELLPWYLASALEEDEAAEVVSHLESCAQCRAELAVESRLRELVRTGATPRIAPHPSSFGRLLERVEAAERRRWPTRARRWIGDALTGLAHGVTPRRVRVAALVLVHNAILVVVVIAVLRSAAPVPPGLEAGSPGAGSAPFVTRSDEVGSPMDGTRLRLVFREDVELWEVVDLLRELGLQLVSGPTQVGVFEAELGEDLDAGAVVESLRSDSRVRLVAGWP